MSVITVDNLGIRYTIRRTQGRSLKRTLFQWLSRELKREQFWALRNVSIEIKEGDIVGIVGANGAGKSTLCMAMAQILPPDEGEVICRGRVAPILSLGAGFNRDMTGRENIRLGCALMGMDDEQVAEVEANVLEFSEIGDFAENPVRTYSTGMRARLAFSIATCIEQDVLILDEVLSVGDYNFRQKSAARMRELMDRARAIILVSHSSETLKDLCNVGLWLHRGEVKAFGPMDEIITDYEQWQKTRKAHALR